MQHQKRRALVKQVLLRHAWQSGAHSLEDISQEVKENMHGQDAATMKRLLSAASNALRDLERVRDDSGMCLDESG
eukprot:1139250-Pelagomonas_calceolata.AAC.6